MLKSFPETACIIDDDVDFVHFLTQYLEARGCQTKGYNSAEALLADGPIEDFGFFVVDLMLPGLDGVDLISIIRSRTQAGIVVISGRMGPDSFNSVLAAGADMFINKPVRFDQIYHAMASIQSRVGKTRAAEAQGWTLKQETQRLVSPGGSEVALSRSELAIVAALKASEGQALTRGELAEAANISPGPDNRGLDAAMFRLRRKIERDTDGPSPIRTVHGVGYQFVKPIA